MEVKPIEKKLARPPLFLEIIENDVEFRYTKSRKVIAIDTARRLRNRKRELIRAAEETLSWNRDKGTNK